MTMHKLTSEAHVFSMISKRRIYRLRFVSAIYRANDFAQQYTASLLAISKGRVICFIKNFKNASNAPRQSSKGKPAIRSRSELSDE